MAPALADDSKTMSFFFDPACPWTWITSRWFVGATGRRGTPVRWRAFSLACINDGGDAEADVAERMQQSQRALRVIESLTAEGRHGDAGDYYTELGTRVHVDGDGLGDDVLLAAGEAAGIDDVAARLEDEATDELIRSSYDEIHAVLGDDVGSPAIRLDATGSALFGPLVNPAPDSGDADKIFAATMTLLEIPSFYELKRSRTSGPDVS